jgi:hypothetical protein
MAPKKIASPLKKKIKDPKASAPAEGGDHKDIRSDSPSQQDNDDGDGYHEPVSRLIEKYISIGPCDHSFVYVFNNL